MFLLSDTVGVVGVATTYVRVRVVGLDRMVLVVVTKEDAGTPNNDFVAVVKDGGVIINLLPPIDGDDTNPNMICTGAADTSSTATKANVR